MMATTMRNIIPTLKVIAILLLPLFWPRYWCESSRIIVDRQQQKEQKEMQKDLPIIHQKDQNGKFAVPVQEASMSNEQGMQLFRHWAEQAISSLLAAVANKRLKSLPKGSKVHSQFGKCSSSASTVPLHAKCLSKLLKDEFDNEKRESPKEKASGKLMTKRLKKYQKGGGHMEKVPEMAKNDKKQILPNPEKKASEIPKKKPPEMIQDKASGKKIRLMTRRLKKYQKRGGKMEEVPKMDNNEEKQIVPYSEYSEKKLPEMPEKVLEMSKKRPQEMPEMKPQEMPEMKPQKMPGKKASNKMNSMDWRRVRKLRHFWTKIKMPSLEEKFHQRRHKRKLDISTRKDYQLHDPKIDGRLSPLGSVAKLLMTEVLSKKGKLADHVKPWQQTIDRLRQIEIIKEKRTQEIKGHQGGINGHERINVHKAINDHGGINSYQSVNEHEKEKDNDNFMANNFRGAEGERFKQKKQLSSRIWENANRRQNLQTELAPPQFPSIPLNPLSPSKAEGDRGPAASKPAIGQREVGRRLVKLLRQGIQLGYSLVTGRNSTEFEGKTVRALSPRFLSVTPEEDDKEEEEEQNSNEGRIKERQSKLINLRNKGENDANGTINLLSPSLLSMHNESRPGSLEQLTNLPSLLQHIGSQQDQQQWMNLIIEAAGIPEHADRIEQEILGKDVFRKQIDLNDGNGNGNARSAAESHHGKRLQDNAVGHYKRTMRKEDGTPLYFTKENVTRAYGPGAARECDRFEKLLLSLSDEQHAEMNQTGFALLSQPQLQWLYGQRSPYRNTEALHRFSSLQSSDQLEAAIERDVHAMAELEKFEIRRQRDVVLAPILFTPFVGLLLLQNPIVLSPILFSPLILAPSVLGPVILSPWMFVPLVLSPRVMSPLILSPLLFNPVILSPLAIHPTILSPGLFNPIILNPAVLSPFILSPQVFTPLILSPLALSPFILNPNAGGPLVLSPFVLSPVILSPQFLSALVLSPYALSPIIASPLVAVSVILSPSWLS